MNMKIMVTLKDPDALLDAVREAVVKSLEAQGLSDKESYALIEVRSAWVSGIAKRWFEFGEYLTVEIDTDAGTCAVVPVDQITG
jgi:hypothetical protein